MSKGDHQLIKAFHKQVNIIESMMKSHMEICPELGKSSELNDELAYLYKLAKTLGERMRELALFRGMVMSLRQENAKLRAKSKDIIQEKEEAAKAQISKVEPEIPLPFTQSRFNTQRIDIFNKKNLTRKQKEDSVYPQEKEENLFETKSMEAISLENRASDPINMAKTREGQVTDNIQEPTLDPMELLVEKEKNIRSMMKKYSHITDTVVLPLTPEILDSSQNKPNKETEEIEKKNQEEEELLWPKPSTPVSFSPKSKEKIVGGDNDLKIDLILTPEEVDFAIQLPQEETLMDTPAKNLNAISIDEEYLEEKEVLKLLQIEKEELQQLVERGDIHLKEQEGNILFNSKEIYNLRAKTMELETIMLEKKKMKKSISRLQKFYRDHIE